VRQNGNVIMVPLSSGPYGINYNTQEVPGGVDSYKQMFDGDYDGRIAIPGDPLATLGVAALTLGFDDPFNMSADELDQAKQFLIDHKSQIRAFPESDSDMVNLFKSGEAVVANNGRGTNQDMEAEGIPVKWVVPKEGSWSWVCGLGITSKAKNIDAAYKLINYFVSDEGQKKIAEAGLTVVNPNVMEMVPKEDRFTADPDSLDNVIAEVQPDNWQAWQQAWKEVKVGG